MKLSDSAACDVLVIGSGLAGTRAALSAAQAGRSVLLLSAGALFSGSSFYPGTWGLGLVEPDGPSDEADLADSILDLGAGMAEAELVKSFVSGIGPAVEDLRRMGVRLKKAQNADETEFIPCFDRKHRRWNGILFESFRDVMGRALEEAGVQVWERTVLLQLSLEGGRVTGAVAARGGEILRIRAGAVVLCTGGTATCFRRNLTVADVLAVGQSCALEAGAGLVNMEFMQIMAGFTEPVPKVIFNEKTYRWLRLFQEDGTEIPIPEPLLRQRSSHGPFTSRFPDRAVDFALQSHDRGRGVLCRYDPSMMNDPPEFVRVYFDWLKEARGFTPAEPFRLSLFAHASNGGIRIGKNGETGVPGLYAAGECTGGMHGADRIGGLSTANGLVFGARAGAAAAENARMTGPSEYEYVPECAEIMEDLPDRMQRTCMLSRCGEDLTLLEQRLREKLSARTEPGTPEAVIGGVISRRRIQTALAVVTAQRKRRESRGSHFRTDHPEADSTQARPNILTLKDL